MADIQFALLTIPTPAAYSPEDPFKGLGDACYVLLQICAQAKAAEFVISAQDFSALIEAVKDLSQTSTQVDLIGLLKVIRNGKTLSIDIP